MPRIDENKRVRVNDSNSRFCGHSGIVMFEDEQGSYEVYLDAQPIGSAAVNEFSPRFRAEQLVNIR